jgi:hypothetical protein
LRAPSPAGRGTKSLGRERNSLAQIGKAAGLVFLVQPRQSPKEGHLRVIGFRREDDVEVLDGPVVLFREVQQKGAIATPYDLVRCRWVGCESKRLVEVGNGVCAAMILRGPIGARCVGRRALRGGKALSRDDSIARGPKIGLVVVTFAEPPEIAIVDIVLRPCRGAQEEAGEQDET